MSYQGPQSADFQNVEALNAAFIGLLLRKECSTASLLAGLPANLQSRFHSLTALQRERLAKTPFLLFSFREADCQYWERLLRAEPTGNLFDPASDHAVCESEVLSAALGFIWQLARDNAYSARLVCGASLHWCEQLAERPLLQVVSVAARADVIRLRREADALMWRKLLYAGVAGERMIRRAARINALQRVLTEGHALAPARAARRTQRPALKVAEGNEH